MSYTHTDAIDSGLTENVDNNSVPLRNRKKKAHLTVKEKNVILNVYNEELSKDTISTIREIVTVVAKKTAVSCSSVYNVVREYKNSQTLSAPRTNQNRKRSIDTLDYPERNAIRRKVHDFYFNNEIPTIDKVLKKVNEDGSLSSFKRTTFYKVLKSLNFKYQRCGRNSMLLDKDDIILWRRGYLRKIKLYRNENRKIYYLGETWINIDHTKSLHSIEGSVTGALEIPTSDLSVRTKNTNEKKKRLIICYIGSNDGFVPDALWFFESNNDKHFHEEIPGQSFENWFSIVLPMLAENAVIVLDNSPHHSRKMEEIPTFSSKKSDVMEWLASKNLAFEADMLKVELLDIVRKHKEQYNKYIIDEMARSHEKTVLRLPPYHSELNPIEFVWEEIKSGMATKNMFSKSGGKIFEAMDGVTKETWQKCIQHVVENVETKMWQLDDIMEAKAESFTTNVNPNDSSSEFSE